MGYSGAHQRVIHGLVILDVQVKYSVNVVIAQAARLGFWIDTVHIAIARRQKSAEDEQGHNGAVVSTLKYAKET